MLPTIRLLLSLCFAVIACGCAGPNALRHSRQDYADAVQITQNEQLLLNLVRLRYRDTPSFLELSNLASQFNFDRSLGVSGSIPEGSSNLLGLSGGFGSSERPTASYSPLQGADFVTKLISPIDEETIILLTRSGWKGDRVFRVAVQSLNGLDNLRRAAGPTPRSLTAEEIHDAILFRSLVQNLEEYSIRRIIRVAYEQGDKPLSTTLSKAVLTPGDAVEAAKAGLRIINPSEQVAIPIEKIKISSPDVEAYLNEELLSNIIAQISQDGLARPIQVQYSAESTNDPQPFTVVGDELTLIAARAIHEKQTGKFSLLACELIDPDLVFVAGTSHQLVMTWDSTLNEAIVELNLPNLDSVEEGRYVLQIEPRSMIGVMFYLSHAICVPQEHLKAGLVVNTASDADLPFSWSSMTGDLLSVQCSKHRPDCAAVAVPYRGYWFYLDDRDHSSKATFALLSQLFELSAGGGASSGPVLTLPVGI